MILMDDVQVPKENLLPNVEGLKVGVPEFRVNIGTFLLS